VIPRYMTPQMSRIWSDANKLSLWFQVELASVWAYESLGTVPKGVSAKLESAGAQIDFDVLFKRALEIEESTKHDVIAFLTALEEKLGDESRHVHFGLTSSDIVDTAFAMQLVAAGKQIESRLTELRATLFNRAQQHKDLPCLGRTHGQAAEITTFGLKLLGFVAEADRGLERLKSASATIAVGKMSGAVGNYANSNPQMEALAMQRLGLGVETVATQVVCRDRHAEFFATLAIIAGTLERLAIEIRLLAHAQIKEAFEPFGSAQRGSSAMPHKRNPILTENITGLARLVRGYAGMAFENEALWHERDISHSSVERVIAPDATHALDFAIKRMNSVIAGLEVDEAKMRLHIDETKGAIFSEGVLLALVGKGVLRQEAYGWVQSAAKRQKAEGASFEDALCSEAKIAEHLSRAEVIKLCDLKTHLKYVDEMFARF
jgi:adenylosuccinate lyase